MRRITVEYDGCFYMDNGAQINYRVDPQFHSEVYHQGELTKASRMIYFYKVSGESLGFKPYFAEIEKLTTVIPSEMRKLYLRKDPH